MYERKRIRRRHAEPLTLAAQQAAPNAYMNEASAADPGHNFGRVAVTAPVIAHSDAFGLIRQADGGRGNEEPDAEEKTPPTLLPTEGLDVEIAGASGDETDVLPMDDGKGRSAGPVRIRAKLNLTTKITDEATDPEKKSDFGITTFNRPTYTARSWSRERGAFVVKATLAADITVKVRPTLGPNGQISIEGDDDTDITSANYPAIVQDLAPIPGKPEAGSPCTHFWARDLTLEHEHFHAGEDEHYGKEGAESAQGQLNGLRAKDAAAVDALLDRVPDFILGNVGANMGPAAERRAYSHVSPDYQARADAIKKKGDRGKYPPPP
jgi:hypothetical protein